MFFIGLGPIYCFSAKTFVLSAWLPHNSHKCGCFSLKILPINHAMHTYLDGKKQLGFVSIQLV